MIASVAVSSWPRPIGSRGSVRVGLVVVLLLAAAGIGFAVVARRRSDEPPPIEGNSVTTRPSTAPTDGAPVVATLRRWAADWTAQVRSNRVLGTSSYDLTDFARELTALLRSRARSSLLRDHDRYEGLDSTPALDDLAALPAVKALAAEADRTGASSLDALDPRLLICDLTQTGRFVPPDQGGVPEPLQAHAPRLATGDRTSSDVVMMRRRLRERLDDLANIAETARRINRPATGLDNAPTLAWVWSLDAERLAEACREPEPGSLPFFAIGDLRAAEVVAASWSTIPARGIAAATFDPFARTPDGGSSSPGALPGRAEAEARELGLERESGRLLIEALRALALHEDEREIRIFRDGWHARPAP